MRAENLNPDVLVMQPAKRGVRHDAPNAEAMKSQQLAHEPEALEVAALPALSRDRFKQGLG